MTKQISSRGRAFTLVELLVVVGIIALLIAILLPSLSKAREQANRIKCSTNLRSIGQSMHLYAHDNRGNYPRTRYIPGKSSLYFSNDGTDAPFGAYPNGQSLPGSPHENDQTAAYFLLVHYKIAPVDVFVCPSTNHHRDSLAAPGALKPKDPSLRSNFMVTDPLGKDFSYSFTCPYPGDDARPLYKTYQYRPTDPSDLALAADRNDGDRWRTSDPDAGWSNIQPMNSSNHNRRGQNVLFNDGAVVWHDTPFCGRGRDNIFTYADGPVGTKHPIPSSKHDSVLAPMFPLKHIAD